LGFRVCVRTRLCNSSPVGGDLKVAQDASPGNRTQPWSVPEGRLKRVRMASAVPAGPISLPEHNPGLRPWAICRLPLTGLKLQSLVLTQTLQPLPTLTGQSESPGAKSPDLRGACAARLKSCPDTKHYGGLDRKTRATRRPTPRSDLWQQL
jgi:hypothetical protein